MSARSEARERTRQQVIASAGECFRTAGFEAATIRQIADHAGVSVGSVMGVGDKQALLIKVFDRRVEAIHHEARRGTPVDPGSSSTADRLIALVRPFVRLFNEDASLSRNYASVLVAGTHRSAVFGDLAETLIREFGHTLAEEGLSPERSTDLARAIYFAYLGVLFSAAGRGQQAPASASLLDELHTVFTAATSDWQEAP